MGQLRKQSRIFKCVLYKDRNEEGLLDVNATRAPVQSAYSPSLSLSARATKLRTLVPGKVPLGEYN